MKIRLAVALAAAALATAPAIAALAVGARAPNFAAPATLGGKRFDFALSKALKKGPVVLYCYPKAFTQGCTLEAHAFAEAHDKFAVAVASPAVIAAYDVALKMDRLPAQARGKMPSGLTDRTSYVIARNGKIAFVHSDLDYREHVNLSLAAVKALGKK